MLYARTIIDIGAGTCNVAELLSEKGFLLQPVDVKNLSFVKNYQPIIFNGTTLPFLDNSFDSALLLDVLHHTSNPEQLLQEAKRVANSVLVMESVYNCIPQKVLFLIIDSFLNMEFLNHPWNYRTDEQWQLLFRQLGFRIAKSASARFWFLFQSQTYVLEKYKCNFGAIN